MRERIKTVGAERATLGIRAIAFVLDGQKWV